MLHARFPFLLSVLASVAACSSSSNPSSPADAGSDSGGGDSATCSNCPVTKIQHLVLIVQENHTFDCHFGQYCKATTGSNPTCTDGPNCCEAGPAKDPAGTTPTVLTDMEMAVRDPNHESGCEAMKMDNGKMDAYATAPAGCGNTHDVAYADQATIKPYWDLAAKGALADRYFQPIVGQSSSNDMYFARANFVFLDNSVAPQGAFGAKCGVFGMTPEMQYMDPTIADLLIAQGVSFVVYAAGYGAMATAQASGQCAAPDPMCPAALMSYPCIFDPTDIPFAYYPSTRDVPDHNKDLTAFATDLAAGTLPAVSFVKGLGYQSEHPGTFDKLSTGVAFVTGLVEEIQNSPMAASTLTLFTYDEGGGYFDHVTPPATSTVDNKPYGTRVPLLALGPFARVNKVSHVVMEHSSIVKFIEFNWLGMQTGQLKTRDAVVANIGSMLDPSATGVAVPEN